jgi:hypothetical protein
MLRHLISLMLVASLTPLALSQERATQPTPEEVARKEAKADQEANAKAVLERQLPAVNFQMVNLSDALDFIRDVSAANIHVNWKALDKAGVTRETPINLQVRQVSVGKVLNLILSDASDTVKLGWTLDDGVIEISTTEALDRQTEIKVYEVRDLLDPRAIEKKGETLSTMISLSIAPNSWKDAGGIGGIKFTDGKLVITQTRENHQAIQNLLDGLRELRR